LGVEKSAEIGKLEIFRSHTWSIQLLGRSTLLWCQQAFKITSTTLLDSTCHLQSFSTKSMTWSRCDGMILRAAAGHGYNGQKACTIMRPVHQGSSRVALYHMRQRTLLIESFKFEIRRVYVFSNLLQPTATHDSLPSYSTAAFLPHPPHLAQQAYRWFDLPGT